MKIRWNLHKAVNIFTNFTWHIMEIYQQVHTGTITVSKFVFTGLFFRIIIVICHFFSLLSRLVCLICSHLSFELRHKENIDNVNVFSF